MRIIISTDHLVVGLFVCDLGQPWYKTSYLRHKFRLTDQSELKKLQAKFSEVEVDLLKSELTTEDTQVLLYHYPAIETYLKSEIKRASEHFSCVLADIQKSSLLLDRKLQKEISQLVGQVCKLPMVPSLVEHYFSGNDELLAKTMRVLILTLAFAKHITLSRKKIESLALAALFHDVGMALLPKNMLRKKNLSIEERLSIEQHVEFSCNIVSQLPNANKGVLDIVANHHENADGSGYPKGLNTRQLTLEAKLFRIVTMYEAMTRETVYRAKKTPIQALEELFKLSKNRVLPAVVTLKFIDMLSLYPTGVPVTLKNDKDAFVLRDNFVIDRLDKDVLLVQYMSHENEVATIMRSDVKRVNYHLNA
ncbi:HD-GYP domain-containing protein [Gayadomonas joobiniege]|uniref:HD-GYP domain-containing protein n=1 Tax=Gayadomonas joobiniege TaxID=1234606 RepID=UPI00036C6336|nr:HD-GYP domain-containing protein [Gayadomonas joobiniege]